MPTPLPTPPSPTILEIPGDTAGPTPFLTPFPTTSLPTAQPSPLPVSRTGTVTVFQQNGAGNYVVVVPWKVKTAPRTLEQALITRPMA
jgi:hypothetical protein